MRDLQAAPGCGRMLAVGCASVVPVALSERRLESQDAAPFFREFKAGLTMDIRTVCLAAAMDDVEAGPTVTLEAARGWARGDVGAALKAPRGFEKCLLLISGGAETWRRNVDA